MRRRNTDIEEEEERRGEGEEEKVEGELYIFHLSERNRAIPIAP